MYVMTTEVWPLGNDEESYPIFQVIGYNSGKKTPEGLFWYKNIVADESTGELNTKEEIVEAVLKRRLKFLKGIPVSVPHDRELGMAVLQEAILRQYNRLMENKKTIRGQMLP